MRYKTTADQHRRKVIFEVGDKVWVIFVRFPIGVYSKLRDWKVGPCKIIKRVNDNAWLLKLPSHLNTSYVFNVKHLIPYKGDPFENKDDDNSRSSFLRLGETDAASKL